MNFETNNYCLLFWAGSLTELSANLYTYIYVCSSKLATLKYGQLKCEIHYAHYALQLVAWTTF